MHFKTIFIADVYLKIVFNTFFNSRVRLECEKEHQEQLLLSVIPAYIAAEVRICEKTLK